MTRLILILSLFLGLSVPAVAETTAPLAGHDVGSLVFVTNKDGNDVVVIDARDNQLIARFEIGPWCAPHMSMISHDGRLLLTPRTKKNDFVAIDLRSGEKLGPVPVGFSPEHFDCSPDSKLCYVANFDEGTVSAIDLASMVEVARIPGFAEPHGVTFTPDGSKAYIANFGAHEVGVVDTRNHRLIKRIAVGSAHKVAALNPERYLTEIKGIANVTLTPDGRYAYAADGDSGEVAVIDTATDSVITSVRVGAEPWRAYSSPDGSLMLVPNNGDKTVSVISTRTNKVVATLKGGEGMTGINFTGNGRKAYAISSSEGAVYVYDMEKMREIKRLKLGSGIVLETASTTADGNRLYLACSTTNSVYVIDGESDSVSAIPNVGHGPWAVAILGGYNYCH
jgi:YVTN family beta-propeller protein